MACSRVCVFDFKRGAVGLNEDALEETHESD
jgi:hypothetical protein